MVWVHMLLFTKMQGLKNILSLSHTLLQQHRVIKHGISPNCFTPPMLKITSGTSVLAKIRETLLLTLLELVSLYFIPEPMILIFAPIFPPIDVLNTNCFPMTVISLMLMLLMLLNLLTKYLFRHHPVLLPAKPVVLISLYLMQV